jgi:hypothetical protein
MIANGTCWIVFACSRRDDFPVSLYMVSQSWLRAQQVCSITIATVPLIYCRSALESKLSVIDTFF